MRDLITKKSEQALKGKVEKAIENVEVEIDAKKLSKTIQALVDRAMADSMRDRDMQILIKKAVKKRLMGMEISFDKGKTKLPRKMDSE